MTELRTVVCLGLHQLQTSTLLRSACSHFNCVDENPISCTKKSRVNFRFTFIFSHLHKHSRESRIGRIITSRVNCCTKRPERWEKDDVIKVYANYLHPSWKLFKGGWIPMIKYKYLSLLKFGGEISLSFWETIIYLKYVPDPKPPWSCPNILESFLMIGILRTWARPTHSWKVCRHAAKVWRNIYRNSHNFLFSGYDFGSSTVLTPWLIIPPVSRKSHTNSRYTRTTNKDNGCDAMERIDRPSDWNVKMKICNKFHILFSSHPPIHDTSARYSKWIKLEISQTWKFPRSIR